MKNEQNMKIAAWRDLHDIGWGMCTVSASKAANKYSSALFEHTHNLNDQGYKVYNIGNKVIQVNLRDHIN